MGAHIFNFVPIFFRTEVFQPKLCILDENFPTIFSDNPKFRRGNFCPLLPLPRRLLIVVLHKLFCALLSTGSLCDSCVTSV